MSDLALDSGHDILLTRVGDMRLTLGVPDAAAQRLSIRLSMYLNEWFLDTTAGVPYHQQILLDVPDEAVLRAIFRNHVQADPYVIAVPRCDVEVDRAARSLLVSFTAQLVEGQFLEIDLSQSLVDGQVTVNGIGVTVDGDPLVIG